MQDPLLFLRQGLAVVELIADGCDDELVQDALHGVANALDENLRKLDAAWDEAWSLTWGYAHGPDAPQVAGATEPG